MHLSRFPGQLAESADLQLPPNARAILIVRLNRDRSCRGCWSRGIRISGNGIPFPLRESRDSEISRLGRIRLIVR